MLRPVIACAALLLVGWNSEATAETSTCRAPFQALLGTETFARYPAKVADHKIKHALPDVRSGQAHLYRTVIREGAKLGPNFAGHYTVVPIGCGAGTSCLAIVDAGSGRVYFPANLRSATALLRDTGSYYPDRLNYRLSSRLLVVVGEPNEDEKRSGMSYYLWDNTKLKLIRYVPVGKLCN